ncbi:MAG: ABC transporter permease subunit [Desulfobacteraceae bacterium]|nr:ABC transporter permease subunit [Desulfobacteraceae bacterium]
MKYELEKYGLLFFIGIVPMLFFFYPIFLMVQMSFYDKGAFSFSNYVKFFSSKTFIVGLFNSFFISTVSIIIISLMGLMIVMSVKEYDSVKRVVKLISSLPMVFSSYIFCIALIYIYGRAGILTYLFSKFGVDFPIYKFLYTKYGIIFANIVFYLPYFIIPLFSSFEEIDPNLEEAAESLGSHGFHKFRKVVFPQVLHGFVTGMLVSFLLIFNQISIVLAIGTGKTYTLTYLIFSQYERARIGMANTIATISLISTFTVAFMFQRILGVMRR